MASLLDPGRLQRILESSTGKDVDGPEKKDGSRYQIGKRPQRARSSSSSTTRALVVMEPAATTASSTLLTSPTPLAASTSSSSSSTPPPHQNENSAFFESFSPRPRSNAFKAPKGHFVQSRRRGGREWQLNQNYDGDGRHDIDGDYNEPKEPRLLHDEGKKTKGNSYGDHHENAQRSSRNGDAVIMTDTNINIKSWRTERDAKDEDGKKQDSHRRQRHIFQHQLQHHDKAGKNGNGTTDDGSKQKRGLKVISPGMKDQYWYTWRNGSHTSSEESDSANHYQQQNHRKPSSRVNRTFHGPRNTLHQLDDQDRLVQSMPPPMQPLRTHRHDGGQGHTAEKQKHPRKHYNQRRGQTIRRRLDKEKSRQRELCQTDDGDGNVPRRRSVSPSTRRLIDRARARIERERSMVTNAVDRLSESVRKLNHIKDLEKRRLQFEVSEMKKQFHTQIEQLQNEFVKQAEGRAAALKEAISQTKKECEQRIKTELETLLDHIDPTQPRQHQHHDANKYNVHFTDAKGQWNATTKSRNSNKSLNGDDHPRDNTEEPVSIDVSDERLHTPLPFSPSNPLFAHQRSQQQQPENLQDRDPVLSPVRMMTFPSSPPEKNQQRRKEREENQNISSVTTPPFSPPPPPPPQSATPSPVLNNNLISRLEHDNEQNGNGEEGKKQKQNERQKECDKWNFSNGHNGELIKSNRNTRQAGCTRENCKLSPLRSPIHLLQKPNESLRVSHLLTPSDERQKRNAMDQAVREMQKRRQQKPNQNQAQMAQSKFRTQKEGLPTKPIYDEEEIERRAQERAREMLLQRSQQGKKHKNSLRFYERPDLNGKDDFPLQTMVRASLTANSNSDHNSHRLNHTRTQTKAQDEQTLFGPSRSPIRRIIDAGERRKQRNMVPHLFSSSSSDEERKDVDGGVNSQDEDEGSDDTWPPRSKIDPKTSRYRNQQRDTLKLREDVELELDAFFGESLRMRASWQQSPSARSYISRTKNRNNRYASDTSEKKARRRGNNSRNQKPPVMRSWRRADRHHQSSGESSSFNPVTTHVHAYDGELSRLRKANRLLFNDENEREKIDNDEEEEGDNARMYLNDAIQMGSKVAEIGVTMREGSSGSHRLAASFRDRVLRLRNGQEQQKD